MLKGVQHEGEKKKITENKVVQKTKCLLCFMYFLQLKTRHWVRGKNLDHTY